jgi:competence protein ComFC
MAGWLVASVGAFTMPRLPTALRELADAALSFVYPNVCQLCSRGRATLADGYVCRECRQEVRFIVPPFCDRCGLPFEGEINTTFECSNCREMELHFCQARSAVAARGPVLEAIHRFKYNNQLWFEEFLAGLFVQRAREWALHDPFDALVPIPLFPVKQRERGFNQAERLARPVANALNVSLETRLLKRVVPTPTQTRLSRRQRAENMRNAFALRKGVLVRGRSFVLVDDVFTTGATASAAAKVLLKAGAERVMVWTVARAEFHG